MTLDRSQPSFYSYPTQNDRTGWQPVWESVLLVAPWRRDKLGDPIDASGIIEVTFGIEEQKGAPVAGYDHVGVFNPAYSLYNVEVSLEELEGKKIKLSVLTFFDAAGNEIDYADAKLGDFFQYTNTRAIVDKVLYLPHADYYDLSTFEVPVDALPDGRYVFAWQASYYPRVMDENDDFLCINVAYEALARSEFPTTHPGEIHADMVNKTPPLYFESEDRKTDPLIQLYRPFADALQDIFDEQILLQKINWIDGIPGQLIPYLAYLIGLDLPYFQTASDQIRKSMLKRGTYLQKLKGTRRAIVELFEIFGFTTELINLWASRDGQHFIAPGESTIDPEEEITTEDVCQVDPAIVDYTDEGFGQSTLTMRLRLLIPILMPSWRKRAFGTQVAQSYHVSYWI